MVDEGFEPVIGASEVRAEGVGVSVIILTAAVFSFNRGRGGLLFADGITGRK